MGATRFNYWEVVMHLSMMAMGLIWLETLAGFYLLMAVSIFLWSSLPTRTEVPLEARISWSEDLTVAIIWPVTMWVYITALAKSLDEEDCQ